MSSASYPDSWVAWWSIFFYIQRLLPHFQPWLSLNCSPFTILHVQSGASQDDSNMQHTGRREAQREAGSKAVGIRTLEWQGLTEAPRSPGKAESFCLTHSYPSKSLCWHLKWKQDVYFPPLLQSCVKILWWKFPFHAYVLFYLKGAFLNVQKLFCFLNQRICGNYSLLAHIWYL